MYRVVYASTNCMGSAWVMVDYNNNINFVVTIILGYTVGRNALTVLLHVQAYYVDMHTYRVSI